MNAIKDVWYIVDHFSKTKGIAHTMLTFQFLDGKAVTFSFEARRDASDRFSPWEGMWRAYELYLSIGFERDMIFLRTNARKNQVHRYRTTTSRRRERQLFMLLARRADELARKPEWYHSLSTTCATELRAQINRISPVRIPYVWRLLLPGHSPRMAYRLGLLQRWGTFEETRERSRIDLVAQAWDGKAITAPCSMRPCPVMPSDPRTAHDEVAGGEMDVHLCTFRHVVHALGAGCQHDILQRPRHACEVNHLYLTVRMQANDHARLSRYGVHASSGILRRSPRSRASRHRSWPQSGLRERPRCGRACRPQAR